MFRAWTLKDAEWWKYSEKSTAAPLKVDRSAEQAKGLEGSVAPVIQALNAQQLQWG